MVYEDLWRIMPFLLQIWWLYAYNLTGGGLVHNPGSGGSVIWLDALMASTLNHRGVRST